MPGTADMTIEAQHDLVSRIYQIKLHHSYKNIYLEMFNMILWYVINFSVS